MLTSSIRFARRALFRGASAMASAPGARPGTASFSTSSAAHPRTATAAPDMACFQCEQTENGTGCTTVGVCGKTPETAVLQDGLVHAIRGLSAWLALVNRETGVDNPVASAFVMKALFSTLTNVNFDPDRIHEYLRKTLQFRDKARAEYLAACKAAGKEPKTPEGAAQEWSPMSRDFAEFEAHTLYGVQAKKDKFGADVAGVQEMIVYGVKGAAAYLHHAHQLGKTDPAVDAKIVDVLAWLETAAAADLGACLGKALEVGGINVSVLAMLDQGHSDSFGAPEISTVNLAAVPGKAILISGHDMVDLEALLKQTEGKGINVYTHGEMLPAHTYPGLKKYKHLVANYGSAWQNQKFEFAAFKGPIVMTSNCLVEPRKSYIDRVFTAGAVGFPGVAHIHDRDFSAVIKKALASPGFTAAEPAKTITTGFGHKTVLSVAGKVIEAIDSGKLKGLHLIGGCDGAEGERSFYTKLAVDGVPKDQMILTLGCAKYRFNKLDHGTVAGLPRLLDMGQCNDSYSAVVVAQALQQHYKLKSINDLPLTLTLSWFEQKAVAVLLSLLHLGVNNITIGPKLPAFVTPNVLKVLVDKFGIKPIPV
jgi:hydroxylamine reductase